MKHTILLAVTGVIMGSVSVFMGIPGQVEPLFWLIFYVLWVVYGVRVRLELPVRRMIAASTLAGLLCGSIQVVFMEQYKAHNPWYAEHFDSPAQQLATQFLGQGIMLGFACGMVVGLVVRWRLKALGTPAGE